jgi:hypothetical protein
MGHAQKLDHTIAAERHGAQVVRARARGAVLAAADRHQLRAGADHAGLAAVHREVVGVVALLARVDHTIAAIRLRQLVPGTRGRGAIVGAADGHQLRAGADHAGLAAVHREVVGVVALLAHVDHTIAAIRLRQLVPGTRGSGAARAQCGARLQLGRKAPVGVVGLVGPVGLGLGLGFGFGLETHGPVVDAVATGEKGQESATEYDGHAVHSSIP